MSALTNPKHERFAQELAKGQTADESYVTAGYKPSRPHASRLATKGNIQARVAEILERGAVRAEVTVASIIAELDEARALAKEQGQAPPMIAASMGKAKVAGLLIDRTEMTGKDGGPIKTEEVSARDKLNDRILGISARAGENGVSGKPH